MEYINLNEKRDFPLQSVECLEPDRVDLSTISIHDSIKGLGQIREYSMIGCLHALWQAGFKLEKREEQLRLPQKLQMLDLKSWLKMCLTAGNHLATALHCIWPSQMWEDWDIDRARKEAESLKEERGRQAAAAALEVWIAWKAMMQVSKEYRETFGD